MTTPAEPRQHRASESSEARGPGPFITHRLAPPSARRLPRRQLAAASQGASSPSRPGRGERCPPTALAGVRVRPPVGAEAAGLVDRAALHRRVRALRAGWSCDELAAGRPGAAARSTSRRPGLLRRLALLHQRGLAPVARGDQWRRGRGAAEPGAACVAMVRLAPAQSGLPRERRAAGRDALLQPRHGGRDARRALLAARGPPGVDAQRGGKRLLPGRERPRLRGGVPGTWSFEPRSLSWWIAQLNLLGSIAFQVSALYSVATPGPPRPSDLPRRLLHGRRRRLLPAGVLSDDSRALRRGAGAEPGRSRRRCGLPCPERRFPRNLNPDPAPLRPADGGHRSCASS